MRRNALCVLKFAVITGMVGGCSLWGKRNTGVDPAVAMEDSFMSPAQATAFGSETYPTYGSPVSIEDTFEPSAPMTALEPRFHTVAKSDTLFRLARTYYNDQRRWKEIYEANRSMLIDPNKIRIGQRLLIP